jgi:cation-transporting P-type ATPase E
VADGELVETSRLRLDESVLTGESEPVSRETGDEVHSGSFAVEGAGSYVVTAVGPESYAEQIAGEARRFRHPRSPLERALNRLLIILVAAMVPLALLLGYALWELEVEVDEAVTRSVAAVVSLVPEGLILLTSLTYAVAAIRMARRGALAQQLNAIESLAAVDVVCLDKTGTLTEGTLRVVELVPMPPQTREHLAEAVARFAASSPSRNATLAAIAGSRAAEPSDVEAHVPFASRRGWSALRLEDAGYVLGAPELFPLGELGSRAAEEARSGRRVLAFGTATDRFDQDDPVEAPEGLEALGLVILAERLRQDARETVAFFHAQGIELKVISGDAPDTVAAIANDAGIAAADPVDGRSLPRDDAALEGVAAETSVVGRISPEGKKRFVEALARSGRYVAMVGDGVNDVPALKAARLAIAQGTGAQIAKSVADIVLVRREFSAVPSMVEEGRKILRNLQRVAKLFVSKSAFAAFLILSIGLTPIAYPVLPRHLTLAATSRWGSRRSSSRSRRAPAGFPAAASCATSVTSPSGRHGRRARGALELPLLVLRARPRSRGGTHGRRLGADPGRALSDPRSRSCRPGAQRRRQRPLPRAPRRLRARVGRAVRTGLLRARAPGARGLADRPRRRRSRGPRPVAHRRAVRPRRRGQSRLKLRPGRSRGGRRTSTPHRP